MNIETYGISVSEHKLLLKSQWIDSNGNRCCHCHNPMIVDDYGVITQATATFEHLVPRMYHGTDKESNLALACWFCNNTRLHFRDPDYFGSIIRDGLKNPTVATHWHRFSKEELVMVQRLIRAQLAIADREWAFEMKEKKLFNKTPLE